MKEYSHSCLISPNTCAFTTLKRSSLSFVMLSQSKNLQLSLFDLRNQQNFIKPIPANIADKKNISLYKSKGGVRACSPGGCRIKVLPIKTKGRVLSEFQSFNTREGSPSFNKIRKLKLNENIEQLD